MQCKGCGQDRAGEYLVPACEDCQQILMAMIATLNPKELSPDGQRLLSPERKMVLYKVRQMARELADSSLAFADPDFPEGRLARSVATVEEMWATLTRSGWTPGKKLKDLLN